MSICSRQEVFAAPTQAHPSSGPPLYKSQHAKCAYSCTRTRTCVCVGLVACHARLLACATKLNAKFHLSPESSTKVHTFRRPRWLQLLLELGFLRPLNISNVEKFWIRSEECFQEAAFERQKLARRAGIPNWLIINWKLMLNKKIIGRVGKRDPLIYYRATERVNGN